MEKGKKKCKMLRELREAVAQHYDIDMKIAECTHQGDCKGVCPKCDAEIIQLTNELNKRNVKIAVGGLVTASALLAGTGLVMADKKNFDENGTSVLSCWEKEDYNDGYNAGGFPMDELIERTNTE